MVGQGLMWRLPIGGAASGSSVGTAANARCGGAAPAVRNVTAESGVDSSARGSEAASGVGRRSGGGLSAATLVSGGGGDGWLMCLSAARLQGCYHIALQTATAC
jgi:hypothetical protein